MAAQDSPPIGITSSTPIVGSALANGISPSASSTSTTSTPGGLPSTTASPASTDTAVSVPSALIGSISTVTYALVSGGPSYVELEGPGGSVIMTLSTISPSSTSSTLVISAASSSSSQSPTPTDPTPMNPPPVTSTATTSSSAISTTSSTASSPTQISSTFTSVSAAGGASATASVIPTPQGSNSTGLIAGVAILAVLLAGALIALAFFLLRSHRKQASRDDYAGAYESKAGPDSPLVVTSLESTIAGLETQLHQKENQLIEARAALVQDDRRDGCSDLDDRQISERFGRLSKSINDWVVTHFKIIRPGAIPAPDVKATIEKIVPNYSTLLQDPQTRFMVLRCLVAEVVLEAFESGELLGSNAFIELKQTIGSKSSIARAADWRIMTATLLEKTPHYRTNKARAVQEISKQADYMTRNLAGQGPSEVRMHHLNRVMEAAAVLAMDLAKQRSLFKVERPGSSFSAASMEDILQSSTEDAPQGKSVQGVVFPKVVKVPDGDNGAEKSVVISRAQVILT